MIDRWKLAKEICNVIKTQNLDADSSLLYILECVISYHINENKNPRRECSWGCADLDENSQDGWYDGYICPTCGYVRGMNKQIT